VPPKPIETGRSSGDDFFLFPSSPNFARIPKVAFRRAPVRVVRTRDFHPNVSHVLGTGTLSFDDFCTLAAKFMTEEEEDSEAIKTELREAFRLYDKEGSARETEKKNYAPHDYQNAYESPESFFVFVPQETVT
jgi:hypothetical protein